MRTIACLLFFPLLICCGPSGKEKVQLRKSLTDAIANAETIREGDINRLTALQADLVIQKDKLNRAQQFQLLRTADQRESQIRSLIITVAETERQIQALEESIQEQSWEITNLKNQLKQYE